MFITIEDERGIANLMVWPKMFETFRRVVLGSTMFAVRGRIQREVDVVHLVAHHVTDMSKALAGIGKREGAFLPARPRRRIPPRESYARP